MPTGLYFKLIMIVIFIILDYFFPRTEIVGQVTWGWKLEPRAIKCNDDRTGTHYLITKMTQTTCRIVSLVNSCKCGLEVKVIDLEIRRSLLYFQLCHQFFSDLQQVMTVSIYLHWLWTHSMMWSEGLSILMNLGWSGTPKVTQEDCEGAKSKSQK